ncbi:MAG TPA: ABC transporter ATP-binding protein [Burkholderiales bacterium]|nr:ABC transporter ATP-binding protein [Burkholderiales bacterium]
MQISVHEITKRFGKNEVVGRSSFSIGEGDLFTLLGPSGCGKTTLLRLIAGFYTPDEGEIRFDGVRVNEVPPHERGIGMVFQNYALWPHMTVFDNIAYGLKLREVGRAEIGERVEAVLEKVRLEGLGGRYPGQLSGGQQQRVALARALVLNPKILLLDEPLSNLDAKIRIQVRAEIRKLQKELGITTVYVTHDQEEALTLSDRIVVFNQGRVFQVGTPRELYERPRNRFVADFIGVNNLLEGTVHAAEGGFLAVDTALGRLRALPNADLHAGDRCVICVRPENIAVGGAGAERNLARGKISFAAYLGNTLRYDVDLGQGIAFKVDERDPWQHESREMGAEVEIGFAWSGTLAIRAAE